MAINIKKEFLPFLLVFLIFILALFLRVYFCFDKFYSDPLKYSADDGIYHMRLIENELLGNHFPHRIDFDPYTNFPNGTYQYFGPLYDQMLAVIIWIVSLGRPTLSIINNVAPFYPVVLGGLTVFIVYFISRLLWGRLTGVLSALLIAVFPSFVFRSLIGSVDHHVAEAFFSSLAMLFLILSLKERKNKKTFWIFSALSGISLGFYALTWGGALLFFAIISLFIFLYFLIRYILGENEYWILAQGSVIFLISLIMVFPFSNVYIYNFQYFSVIISAILAFIFLGFLGFIISKKKLSRYLIFPFILLSFLFFLIVSKLLLPDLFNAFLKSLKSINVGVTGHALARELIGEMEPLKITGAFKNFYTFIYIFFIGLGVYICQFLKKKSKDPISLLLIVWSLFILLMTGIIPFFGQQRFIIYLAINVSLFSGFIIIKFFRFGWKGLEMLKSSSISSSFRPFVLAASLLVIFNIIFFMLFPFPLNLISAFPDNMPQIVKQIWDTSREGLIIKEADIYKTMAWIRENTPDPGVDYYQLYKDPYSYPKTAYGILAGWDIGHMITYYAHRMPVANPFQQGIGRKEGDKVLEAGEAIFFIETDEEKAVSYLDELKVRYIITDYFAAIPDSGFRYKIKWVSGSNDLGEYQEKENSDSPSKFDNSMIARLQILDGRHQTTKRKTGDKEIEFYIKPLDHFRLVYESETTTPVFSVSEGEIIKEMKIFEYVKGAKIVGQTTSGSKVYLSAKIKTNQNREFIYEKEYNAENGFFEFIVPYSTFGKEGWIDGQTKFAVFADSYKLKIGEKEIEINISESEVLEGKIIGIK